MTPTLSPAEALEHAVFMALMWAMSHPGEVQTLEGLDSLESVGKALLDLETGFYTPSPELQKQLVRLGAQPQTAQEAIYQFYPQVDASALAQIGTASVGSLPHPETGATLVLGAELRYGVRLRLSGPGIQSVREIEIGGIPRDFWNLRNERVSFPLGWDIFLVGPSTSGRGDGGEGVLAIPRSTHVEVI